MMPFLKTDYLVIGSGAVGMAFVDTLLDEMPDAGIIMVDRFAKPGGHWNSAYPFVTLHQPSAFYGVNSRELSQGVKDETGFNKGLGDLATGAEILAYFDSVMRHKFLASGRVRFFPLSDYQGNGVFKHRLSGIETEVSAKKIVDCTYLNTNVPSTHTPNFDVFSEFFEDTIGNQANMFEAIAKASSKSDMFDRLEACGYFLRLDTTIRPTMFHGATISEAELAELRRVKDIVRKGRVSAIEADRITFVNGRTEPTLGHIMVDCSASAIKDNVIKPVFQEDTITPQTIRAYQPVFSASQNGQQRQTG